MGVVSAIGIAAISTVTPYHINHFVARVYNNSVSVFSDISYSHNTERILLKI